MSESKKIKLVQGKIFISGDDGYPVNSAHTTDGVFHGYIIADEKGELTGFVRDQWGSSRLSNIVFETFKLSFDKKYSTDEDLIHYSLTRRDGNEWVGIYESQTHGYGIAWLAIQEVDSQLFLAFPTYEIVSELKILGHKFD